MSEEKKDALAKAEEIQERSIQVMALEYVPDAISTLGKFARGKKVGAITPTAGVVQKSARDIIEFAGGRPETRDPRVGEAGAVQVVIQQFGPEVAQKILAGEIIGQKKFMKAAVTIDIEGSKVGKDYEVPD